MDEEELGGLERRKLTVIKTHLVIERRACLQILRTVPFFTVRCLGTEPSDPVVGFRQTSCLAP